MSSGDTRFLRSKLRGGFTLVELLVVIGIIALLISILLPALNKARQQAMTVKCASNLRQCGAALDLYANFYKGYAVPLRCGGGDNAASGSEPQQSTAQNQLVLWDNHGYWIKDFCYDYNASGSAPQPPAGHYSSAAAWWMNFLAPFISTQRGGVGDTTSQDLALARQTVFWCPAWPGSQSPGSVGGFNEHRTGYSMNYMPSLTAYYPPAWQNADPGTGYVPQSEWFNISFSGAPAGTYNRRYGTWYKMSQIRDSQHRCFLADCTYDMLTCWQHLAQPARGQAVVFPPENELSTANANINQYTGGGTGIQGQNSFDYYRHGTYPKMITQNGGLCFDPFAGKVAFNILFYDGHVELSNDRADAYRSVRMRFPQ